MQTQYYTSETQTNKEQVMTKTEQLAQRMEELRDIIYKKQQAFMGSPEDTGWEAYQEHTAVEQTEFNKLSRQYRVLVDADLEEWDGNGDMFDIETFVAYCKGGGFIDYDGFGHYSDGVKVSDVEIYPSDVTKGNYRKDFTHVIWYNK